MIYTLDYLCVSSEKNLPFQYLIVLNPYPAELIYLNFHPPEVVSRYRDPQLQVPEN